MTTCSLRSTDAIENSSINDCLVTPCAKHTVKRFKCFNHRKSSGAQQYRLRAQLFGIELGTQQGVKEIGKTQLIGRCTAGQKTVLLAYRIDVQLLASELNVFMLQVHHRASVNNVW